MASNDDPTDGVGGGIELDVTTTGFDAAVKAAQQVDKALQDAKGSADDLSDGLGDGLSKAVEVGVDAATKQMVALGKAVSVTSKEISDLIKKISSLDATKADYAQQTLGLASQLGRANAGRATLQNQGRQDARAQSAEYQSALDVRNHRDIQKAILGDTLDQVEAFIKRFTIQLEQNLIRSLDSVLEVTRSRGLSTMVSGQALDIRRSAAALDPDVMRYRRQGVNVASTDLTQLGKMQSALELNATAALDKGNIELAERYANTMALVQKQIKDVIAAERERAVEAKGDNAALEKKLALEEQAQRQQALSVGRVLAFRNRARGLSGEADALSDVDPPAAAARRVQAARLDRAAANLTGDAVEIERATVAYQEAIKVQQDLKKAIQERAVAEREAKRQSPQQESVQDRFQRHSTNMMDYMVFGSMFAGIAESVRSVVELDKSFGELQALTQASNSQMLALRESITQVAQASNQSAKDIVEATIVLGKFGFTASQTQESLKSVVDFASATRMKPQDAATMLTGAVGAYDLPATSTSNVADLATSTLAKSRLTAEALRSGLSLTAEIGAETNVSLKELVGTMALAADAGVRMQERFGTGLRQAMTALANPTEDLSAELAQVGLNSEAVDLKSNGLIGAFKNMYEAGFTNAQAMKTLGAEGGALYSALSKNIEGADAFIAKMGQEGAAAAAAERNLNTLAGSFDRLANTWSTTLEKGTTPLAGLLKELADMASATLGVTNAFPSLTAGVTAAGAAFAGIKMVSFTRDLLGLNAGIAAAVRGLLSFNPVVAGITAAVAAAAVGYSLWEEHGQTLAKQIDELKGRISGLSSDIESSEKTIRAIDEAIVKFAADGEELKHPTETVKLLNDQFGSLGFHIDGATRSTADLIAKLNQLKADTVNGIVIKIDQERNALGQKAGLDRQQIDQDINKGMYALGANFFTQTRGGPIPPLKDAIDALNQSRTGTDPGERAEALHRLAQSLQQKMNATDDKDVKDKLQEAVTQLLKVSGELSDLAKVPGQQADLAHKAATATASLDPSSYAARAQSALLGYQGELAGRKDLQDHTTQGGAQLQQAENRLALFDQRTQGILAELGQFVHNPDNKNDVQYPSAQEAYSDLSGRREGLQASVNKLAESLWSTFQKTTNLQIAQREAQIGDLKGEAGKATNVATVKANQEQINRLTEEIRQLRIALAQRDPSNNPRIHPGAGTAAQEAQAELTANEQAKSAVDGNNREAQSRLESLGSAALAVAQQEAQAKSAALKAQIDNLFKAISEPFTSNSDKRVAIEKLQNLIPEYLKDQVNLAEIELKQHKGTPTEMANRRNVVATEGANLQLQLEAAQKKVDAGPTWSQQNAADTAALAAATAAYNQRSYEANKVVADAQVAAYQRELSGQKPTDGQKQQMNGLLLNKNQADLNSLGSFLADLSRLAAQLDTQVGQRRDVLAKTGYNPAKGGEPVNAEQANALKEYNEALTKQEEMQSKISSEEEKQLKLLQQKIELEKQATPKSVGGALSSGWMDYSEKNPTGMNAMLGDIRSGTSTVLQSSQQAFANFFTAIEQGTNKASNATHRWTTTLKNDFRSLATGILQSMQQVINNMLAKQFMSLLGNGLGSAGSALGLGSLFGGGGSSGDAWATSGSLPDIPVIPEWHGGRIRHLWHGGKISERLDHLWHGGHIREHLRRAATGYDGSTAVATRDSVPILAAPGEFIMRQSAVDLIGADTLSALNAAGNSYASQSGKSLSSVARNVAPSHQETNVYVVNKDQQPAGLGPNDVIAAWSQDVLTGGASKKLIKSVVNGDV